MRSRMSSLSIAAPEAGFPAPRLLPQAWQEAVALYRGPLLPDCPEEWAAVERNHARAGLPSALETLGTHFAVRGDPARPYTGCACSSLPIPIERAPTAL